jgi:dihydrofolate synthase/folylpolyglutamate synthase
MLADAILQAQAGGEVLRFASPREAYDAARNRAGGNDRIVVFGSFHTVAEVMMAIQSARAVNPGVGHRS